MLVLLLLLLTLSAAANAVLALSVRYLLQKPAVAPPEKQPVILGGGDAPKRKLFTVTMPPI